MVFYKFYKTVTSALFKVLYRVKIEGESNIPKEKGYMICANHIHAFDPVFISASTKHEISYMAKKELFKIPIFNWFLKACGFFSVDRGNADLNSIKKAIEVLKNKKVLSIFPEGTRHRDGKFRDIKQGAALVAIQSKAKIVPMRIIGNYRPFSKMTLRIGEPISSVGCTMEELTEKLRLAIENLALAPAV